MYIAIGIFVILPAILGLLIAGREQVDSLDLADLAIQDLYHGDPAAEEEKETF